MSHKMRISECEGKRAMIERFFKKSPFGELLDEIDDLTEMLNKQSREDSENETVCRYRVVMAEYLFLIGIRTERLLFFFGFLFGTVFCLLLKGAL